MHEPDRIVLKRPASRRRASRALLLAILLALPGGAQMGPVSQRVPLGQPIGQGADNGLGGFGNLDPVEEDKRLNALNAERQRLLVSDTVKLLKLAGELHAEIDAGNPDSLSPIQVHKLDAIEKLAHSVKEKMSTSVRIVPVFPQRFPGPMR